jgi:23S rRNA pseudouridine2605 synthase
MPLERLQKVLARAGVASRRGAEALIEAGRVHVDGRAVTELGTRVDARRQRVEVDGKRIEAEPLVYILLHKPRAVVSTMSDPEGRPTVAELVRAPTRVVPVGRLDFHTSGVLLLTNDGDFAAALAHPSKGALKVYVAKVGSVLDDQAIERLEKPIFIEGRATRPAEVKRLRTVDGKTWIEVRLREGRNRQVRRMVEAAGFTVMRLARLEFAGLTSEGLRPGTWRYLGADELAALKKQYGVPRRIVSPPARAPVPARRARAAGGAGGARPARARRANR